MTLFDQLRKAYDAEVEGRPEPTYTDLRLRIAMDPHTALYELLVSLQQGNRQEAVELCESLSQWLSKGGALPPVFTLTQPNMAPAYGVSKPVISELVRP